MANKDGVARGRTRFNLRGRDLNRNWDKPADPELAPENAALERWLEGEIAAGRRPHLALELHNDGNGRLHVSRPPVPQLERHLARMAIFEELLRSKTWFTEGTHQCRVPQQRHARRRLARALRHRRGRPRVQLQLDRRAEGLHVEPALEGLRRQPRGGVSRLLRSGEAVSLFGRQPLSQMQQEKGRTGRERIGGRLRSAPQIRLPSPSPVAFEPLSPLSASLAPPASRRRRR